jgi:hypothetical protein
VANQISSEIQLPFAFAVSRHWNPTHCTPLFQPSPRYWTAKGAFEFPKKPGANDVFVAICGTLAVDTPLYFIDHV